MEEQKFRLMYLLRSMISPVSSIRYYQELHSLKSIDKILEMQPTLPAKIHRPYLHKEGWHGIEGKTLLVTTVLSRVYQ